MTGKVTGALLIRLLFKSNARITIWSIPPTHLAKLIQRPLLKQRKVCFKINFFSATILALHFTPVSHCVSHWASCSFEQASTLFWRSLAGGVWLEESPLLLKFSSRQPSKQGFVAFLIDLPAVVVCCDLSLHHHPALSQLSFGLKLPPFLSAVSKSN